MKGALSKTMPMAKYQTMIVMLLTLVFTGQVLASAKPSCQGHLSASPEQQSVDTRSAAMADHSHHMPMAANEPSAAVVADHLTSAHTTADHDCCSAGECSSMACELSGCTSVLALSSTPVVLVAGLSLPAKYQRRFVITPLTTSLFRPPIFR